MQTPPTPRQKIRQRRRSRGKGGVDAELLRERLVATMYSGQKVSQDASKIAKYLNISIEDVRRMPSQKRLLLSSLIDIDKSSLLGEKAAEQRVLSLKISKGEFSSASKMLNAPFKALKRAEEECQTPAYAPNSKKELNIDEECATAGLSEEHAASLKRQLKLLETQIREDPDCGHVNEYRKNKRLEIARAMRQQLLYIDEKTLKPNIAKQEQVRQKLSEEANKAIVGEYKERLENLEVSIEGIEENSRKSLQLQEMMAEDTVIIKKMQREAKRKIKEYHEQQMQEMSNVMTTLQRIDYNTTESGLETRLNRQLGLTNVYGLTWLAKDFAKIFTSVLFDDVWQFKVSVTRPVKQMFSTAVTLIEVLMKYVHGGLAHLWSGIYCFRAHPLTCIMGWALKTLAGFGALLVLWLACEQAFPVLIPYIKEMSTHMLGSLKWASAKLNALVEGVLGDILGRAWEQFCTYLSDFTETCTKFFYENIAGVLEKGFNFIMNKMVAMLSSLMAELNPTTKVAKMAQSLADSAGEVATGVSSYLPWNWLGELDNPQFRQWVLTNPGFQNHMVSIQEVEEEDDKLKLKF